MTMHRPRYADAVATLALALAVAGTAVAGGGLPGKNSVGSREIAKGQVKRPDLARNSVTGVKVKAESLSDKDVGGLAVNRRVVMSAGSTSTFVLARSGDLGIVPTCTEAGDEITAGVRIQAGAEVARYEQISSLGPSSGWIEARASETVATLSAEVQTSATAVLSVVDGDGDLFGGRLHAHVNGPAGDCEIFYSGAD